LENCLFSTHESTDQLPQFLLAHELDRPLRIEPTTLSFATLDPCFAPAFYFQGKDMDPTDDCRTIFQSLPVMERSAGTFSDRRLSVVPLNRTALQSRSRLSQGRDNTRRKGYRDPKGEAADAFPYSWLFYRSLGSVPFCASTFCNRTRVVFVS
jgi:hypothetical protein